MNKRINFRKIASLLVFLAIFLLFISDCHARIGGGGGYGGGSSSGGGGYSGGGYGGGSSYGGSGSDTVGGFVFLLIFAAISYFGVKREYKKRTIFRASRLQSDFRLIGNLKLLRQRDPLFDLDSFEDRVANIFFILQNSWSNQDMKTIRRYVSDSTFERFSILNKMYQENGIRNHISDVEIRNCKVISVESDQFYDTLKVAITATAVDYFTKSSSRRTYGFKEPEPFTEYWSFLRKRGAKSLQSGGLMSGYCPNCSNPLHLNDRAECSSCGSIVTSGEYDWVLSEITQIGVYSNVSNAQISSIDELSAKDPGFCIQSIEDKVSTAFWAIRYSEFVNNYCFAQRFVTEELYQSLNRTSSDEQWEFSADPAVGSVDLIDFYSAEDDEYDRLRVKVSWSGRDVIKKRGDKFLPDFDNCFRMAQEYTLKRHKDVKTFTQTSMMSLHCPNCGAPASEKSSAICQYCQTSFVDGSRDWVIESIQSFTGYTKVQTVDSNNIVTSIKSVQEAPKHIGFVEDKLIAVIQVMMADGVIDEHEVSALKSLSSKYGYGERNLNQLIRSVKEGSLDVDMPDNIEDAREMLVEIIKMAMADGRICSKEKALIKSFANQLGYTTEFDINHMVKRAKAELYKESKETLRLLRKAD